MSDADNNRRTNNMRTIRTKVYKFDELTPAAQDKAIELLYDLNVSHNWYEWTIENMVEMLAENGFDNAEILFSGFWSQGDGACFDADINLSHFTTDKRIVDIARNYCDFRIEKTSYANHYSHEKTRYVEYNGLDEKLVRINEALQKLSDTIEERRLSLSKQIYRDLEQEYEYQTSKEAIIETIQANEYDFFKDGKLYDGR